MNRSFSALYKIVAILIILVLSGQSAVLAQNPFGGTSSVVQQDAVTLTPIPATPTVTPEPQPIQPTPTSSIEETEDGQEDKSAPDHQAGVSYYVNIATGNNFSSCISPSTPCKNIQETINKASSGAIIHVSSGTYLFSHNPSPNVMINNGKNLTISGGWNDNFTSQDSISILDGENLRNGYLHTGGTVTLENFIIQNSVSSNSGAIYMISGDLTLKHSTLKNNNATSNGAGIFLEAGNITIINSTISGNSATGSGGGIHTAGNPGITVNIINSTIANNAASTGGGISHLNGVINLLNTIVADNTASAGPDCNGTINIAHHNIIENASGCVISNGSNNSSIDPLLGNLSGIFQIHAPKAGSPAINAGMNADCPTEDQQGIPRPQGDSCDIGSVEVIGNGTKAVHALKGNDQTAPITTNFPFPFTVLVLDENDAPVNGVSVTFTAPFDGASGIFTSTGTNTASITTNDGGRAVSPVFTANALPGTYTVMVSTPGYPQVEFHLTNILAADPNSKYVTPTGSDENSCSSPDLPCLTINGAINKAVNGNTIRVAIGTYTGTGSEVVLINKSVTISGGWNLDFTEQNGVSTIDGEIGKRGITISSQYVTAIVNNFVIQNGYSSADGGGIYNFGNLTLNNSIVKNNISGGRFGGGIMTYNTLTLNNSSVIGNSLRNNVTFSGGGGGIANHGDTTLNNSTVYNNITTNSFLEGSGIYSSNRKLTLNNSTVSRNRGGDGHGIHISYGTVTINNSTISKNAGKGIYNQGGVVSIKNTIVAANGTGGDCLNDSWFNGGIISQGYNLIGNGVGCELTPAVGDQVGSSFQPINPGLAAIQDNGGPTPTHALLTGSPAIDAGSPASSESDGACLSTDQRGVARPMNTSCDIGAYESEAPVIRISGNVGVAGATLHYTTETSMTILTDIHGNYSIALPPGWSGTITPSKLYYSFSPDKRTYDNLTNEMISQNFTAVINHSNSNIIKDPSFELYTPNPHWTEFSQYFQTPLCMIAICGNGGGTAHPRTGSVWSWFGGTVYDETASLSQTVIFPSGYPNLKLQFYFWIGWVQKLMGNYGTFEVRIDNYPVFSANETQQNSYRNYTPVLVDVSAYSDGAPHTIEFFSTARGVTFNLDDIALTNSSFYDVPSDFFAVSWIDRLFNAGITGGCSTNPLMYCPNTTVTRAQMAVFLLKGIHGSSYTPPPASGTVFADVPVGSFAAAWIEQMVAEGITAGCGGGNFCPNGLVNRAQMAVFLLRAKHGMGYSPPSATGTAFNDVPSNGFAASWIEQLVTEGITSGCGGGNYCPNQAVTRAQMAVFLIRTFNLP